MPDWMPQDAWVVWLALALVLGVVEAATADLVFLMLAGGSFAATGAALLGADPIIQCLVAAVVAVALLAGVRPVVRRRLAAGDDPAPVGTQRYVGQVVVVTQEVTTTTGQASISGETWSARLADDTSVLHVGASARITQVRGATLVLTAASPVRDLPQRREDP